MRLPHKALLPGKFTAKGRTKLKNYWWILLLNERFLPSCSLFLPRNINTMSNEIQEHKEKDFGYNWVNSSRFLFYVQLFCILAFVLGGCYQLYQKSYAGKPEVAVPESSLYTPKYK